MKVMQGLEHWGRERVLGVLARAMPAPQVSAQEAGESLRRNPSARILLIGIYQKMGQFLCATPLVRALAAAWPGARLHFLGNPENAAVARANPRLERVWVWKKSAFWAWPVQWRALRKERFDLALLLTTERPSATGVLLARATGATWVGGFNASVSGDWARDTSALCHIRIPFSGEKNEVEKYLGLARAFHVSPQGLRPEIAPSPEDTAAADAFISAQTVSEKGPWVGLFIGGKAEREDRLWPVAHFAQLADTLKRSGLRVVAISPPPPEHVRLDAFQKALGWTCPVFRDASVLHVAAFLRKLDLLVCPDGGILHLAAAAGVPTLGLFFSTDPDVWSHDLPQAILDGRGRPAAELEPEIVSAEVVRFVGSAVQK